MGMGTGSGRIVMTDFNLTEFLHVILSHCHILQAKRKTKEKEKKRRNEKRGRGRGAGTNRTGVGVLKRRHFRCVSADRGKRVMGV